MTIGDGPAGGDAQPHQLPDGRQLVVTWGIPEPFGGMTSALLHRSRAFVQLAGRDIDVLTFDPTRGSPTCASTSWTPASSSPASGSGTSTTSSSAAPPDVRPDRIPPGACASRRGRRHRGPRWLIARRGTAGRASGRARAPPCRRHARPARRAHARVRCTRLITAYDEAGDPVRQWTGAWAFYADWLDGLIGADRAFAITDSKTVANFMAHTVARTSSRCTWCTTPTSRVRSDRTVELRPSRRAVFTQPRAVRRRRVPHRTAARGCRDPRLRPGQSLGGPERDRPARRRARARSGPGPRGGRGGRRAHAAQARRPRHRRRAACRRAGLPVTLVVFGDGRDAAALPRTSPTPASPMP